MQGGGNKPQTHPEHDTFCTATHPETPGLEGLAQPSTHQGQRWESTARPGQHRQPWHGGSCPPVSLAHPRAHPRAAAVPKNCSRCPCEEVLPREDGNSPFQGHPGDRNQHGQRPRGASKNGAKSGREGNPGEGWCEGSRMGQVTHGRGERCVLTPAASSGAWSSGRGRLSGEELGSQPRETHRAFLSVTQKLCSRKFLKQARVILRQCFLLTPGCG